MGKALGYLLVNFGGPRSLTEVEPFLEALLTDQDVVRTGMPHVLHKLIFQRVAKKRAKLVTHDYSQIGGKSPIFEDTEAVAKSLQERLNAPVIPFHRYLMSTHEQTFEALEKLDVDEIHVFPMFPQFTYATTGSAARIFHKMLSIKTLNKLKWVKSYPSHPAFISLIQKNLRNFLEANGLKDEETILLFSAHGVPEMFVDLGDLYQNECETSFKKVMEAFPRLLGRLCYQSKFGPGEWLKPYTIDLCETIERWHEGRPHVVFVPISFTSDHVETLSEIEYQYMPVIREQDLFAYRLPAFNRDPEWIEAIATILSDFNPVSTSMLVRWEK